jgi:hypothetical protein
MRMIMTSKIEMAQPATKGIWGTRRFSAIANPITCKDVSSSLSGPYHPEGKRPKTMD